MTNYCLSILHLIGHWGLVIGALFARKSPCEAVFYSYNLMISKEFADRVDSATCRGRNGKME